MRNRRCGVGTSRVAIWLCGMALAGPAAASPRVRAATEAPIDEPAPLAATRGERYVGVAAPGSAGHNPLALPRPQPTQLVWTGFRMKEGGSQVFLQTTRSAEFQVTPGPSGHLKVLLRNCRIHLENNRRNLDTRFFATPVAAVKARQRRKDVELEIILKEPVTPESRTEPGPDGTQFLVLEFPPGQAKPQAVANSAAANAR